MRLIVDPPADGPVNMARDEVLLCGVADGTSPATLRLYRWHPPTISLGYFQRFADYAQLPAPAGALAVVRRTTGGGAILHDAEWTYSLALPSDDPRCHPDPGRLYERVHDAVVDTLQLLGLAARRCGHSDDSAAHRGPFFCFERRHCLDVLLGETKLAGSAQRRTRRAVLQHGSIILDNRFPQHRVAALREHVAVAADDLLEPLLEALARRLGEPLDPAPWSAREQRAARDLRAKYAGDDWTRRF